MAVQKQDVGILVGVLGGGSISGESGIRIQEQINSIMTSLNKKTNSAKRGIIIGLNKSATDAALKEGISSLVAKYSTQKKYALNLKVQKIDATSAIADVKSKLQAMLNSLSVKNGVTISGLTDPTDNSKTMGTDETAASAAAAKAATDSVAGYVKTLNDLNASLRSTFKNGSISPETLQEYNQLQQKITEINAASQKYSQEEIESTQSEVIATRAKITALREEAQAQQQAAAQEQAGSQVELASQKQILSVYKQIDSYLRSNPKAQGTALYAEAESMREALKPLLSDDAKLPLSDLNTMQNRMGQISIQLREANKEGRTFGGVITAAYQKFGGWMLITRSMSAIIRSFKQMITNVKEIDTAMTELRKVTDETDATYTRFLENAAIRARAVGATLTDTINASADFARLGYGIEDASTLADVALIYKNVGDGIDDIGTASESVISTMKAFKIEANDAMSIVDKFNAVGNAFSISSAGVGEALTRSASALAAANNTLDESIALVTAANDVVQNPEKVGRHNCPAA